MQVSGELPSEKDQVPIRFITLNLFYSSDGSDTF